MNLKSCFTLLMGMALASITFAQETITLKFNPQKGTSVSYTISTEMHNKMMGMDNPMSMEMKMTGLTEEADSGRIKMVNQFNSIKISMTMMGQNINYDSENPTNDNPMAAQFGQSFGQILNKPITYIMNTDGSIHKLEGFDNLRQGMGMGVDPNQFAQGMALFPKKPVKTGESWTSENEVAGGNGIAMKSVSKWTLDAVENGIAKLTVKTDLSGKLENAQIPGMAGDIKGVQSAKMEVDITSGITLKSIMEQDMTMGSDETKIEIKSKTTMIGSKS